MKNVKKRLPYELYDAAGLEQWFQEMAAKGLHLVKCGAERAVFQPGEPAPSARYRLEAQDVYDYDPVKDPAYAEAGWTHVTTIRNFYCIYRADDPAAEELHTDPVTQSYTMKRLIRRQWRWLLFLPLWYLFLARDAAARMFHAPAYFFSSILLRDGFAILFLILVLLVVQAVACQAVQLHALRSVKLRLAEGLRADEGRRYPRSFWKHGFVWVLLALMFATLILLFQDPSASLDSPPQAVPHITLEEVLSPDSVRPDPDLSTFDEIILGRSTLVPVRFYSDESGLLGQGADTRKVYITIEYYKSASPAIAGLVLKGQIQEFQTSISKYVKQREGISFYEDPAMTVNSGPYPTQYPGLDELYLYDFQFLETELPRRAYFGRIGSEVVCLRTCLPQPDRAFDLLTAQLPAENQKGAYYGKLDF